MLKCRHPCLLLGATSFLLLCGDVTSQTRSVPAALSIGSHLSALRQHPVTGEDFKPTSTREFLDLMKHSTPFCEGIEQGIVDQPLTFVPYGIPAGIVVNFTRDGYPVSLPNFTQYGQVKQVSVKASIGLGGNFVKDGEYVATWLGKGHISFEGDATLLESRSQSATILVQPQNGVIVRLVRTDEADPLRAITLLPVAFQNSTQLFHPTFLSLLQNATVLRFKSWQEIDEWDRVESFERVWTDRPLPSDQTQAGRFGVCVEYMIELANQIGAHPWFSMPRAPVVTPGTVDPYAASFAAFTLSRLRTDLRVYIEYRSCCLNGLAPGWNSQENAEQSITAWHSWEASGWNASRVVNLISSLQQIGNFGSDINRVEAAAIDASFRALCLYGESPCVNFDDNNANGTFGPMTPQELVEQAVRPAMFKREAQLNSMVQQAFHYGLEIIAFGAFPLLSARSYGHRGTLSWALQCEQCLMSNLGRRYGIVERVGQAGADGWVWEEAFVSYYAYQGIDPQDRATNTQGVYWLTGSVDAAKAMCKSGNFTASCDGFTYIKSGEWSCGPSTSTFRYGDCPQPGTAYFFNRSRIPSGSNRKPPTSCQAFTVPAETSSEKLACQTPATIDTYFRPGRRTPGSGTEAYADAASVAACNTCQVSFQQHYYSATIPPLGFNLDRLHLMLPALIAGAAAEQALEWNMVEALRDDAVESLMLEYLDRLRQIGFSVVVGAQLHLTLRGCRAGGKACGQTSLMIHPDDESPIQKAFTAYSLGMRASPAAAPTPAAACPQPCVYGVCELGSCRCWTAASGADCSILGDLHCYHPRSLGLSLSGVSYWTREWIFVDVFKHVGDWVPVTFTDYTWNTGIQAELRSDGYPARLLLNQAAQLLTVRDVEKHYVSGWYTVLYDGDGILDFNMDVTAVSRQARGKIQIYLNLSTQFNNGLGVRLSHTREDNPVRNIRIITPGFEQIYDTSPFHPAYLASLRHFSVLRFMDFMHASVENTPWAWENRAMPSDYTQGGWKGVSVEYMVRLSNELASDPWFSLPTNATDDYIRQFSELVHSTLRPDLGIYLELGNEVWHFGFFGGQYAQQQGSREGIGYICWYAKRTAEMADIARTIFSQRRLTVVAGSQAVNADVTRQLLLCPGIEKVDAFGLAPYFNGYNVLPNPDADISAVLASFENEINKAMDLVRAHKAFLAGKPYKLVAYEAGPACEGDGGGSDLCIRANRHSGMMSLVERYLREMSSVLDLIVYFASCGVPSKYGAWGMIESMDQPRNEAVKYQAVQDFIRNATSSPPFSTQCSAITESLNTSLGCVGAARCSGNGVCGTDDQCYCYRGFSGSSCLGAAFTDYLACGYRCTFDQGVCEVSQIIGNARSWACRCGQNYSGATCSRFHCQDGCNQRGHCIADGVCSCFRGFRGDACEIDCGCDHHGQCNDQDECICDQGWRRKSSGRGCEWNCDSVNSLGCSGPGQSACASCQWGTCVDGFCRCWAGYYGAACSLLNTSLKGNAGSSFGINVALTPSTFVDVMKTSSGWTSVWDKDTQAGQFSYQGNSLLWTNNQYQWGNGQAINLTEDGYASSLLPNQAVISLALRDVCLHAPKGRYVVLYDGDGDVDFAMDAAPAAFQKGRIDVDFQPTCQQSCWYDKQGYAPYCSDNGIAITVRSTNPANPIRNLRVIMPGFLSTHEVEPFHPWFLKNLERFASIRLMGWSATNRDSWVPRTPVVARYIRFTSLAAADGGVPRVAELLLRGPESSSLSCTSTSAPELCDGNPDTDWAPSISSVSPSSRVFNAVVELSSLCAVSSYMWMTSGWASRVDPVQWLLESSTDGITWTILDERRTRQPVTYYRRECAAKGSPEESSWYPIRLPSDLLHWKDRILPRQRVQDPVALEYQVLLANTIGAAPWVCVHHLASDDYVREEAAFWLENLRPDVSVYVEHSNEVWNPLFPQGRYATKMGTQLNLVNSSCRASPDMCARARYNAWRSKQIFNLWTDVWGAARTRLSFVLSTQLVWTAVTEDLFSVNNGAGADLLGITAYMEPAGGVDESYSSKESSEVIQRFVEGIEPVRQMMRTVEALASGFGVGIAVYEAGVSLVQAGTIETGSALGAITELLMSVGRSPDFRVAVETWLDMYQQELGESTNFNYFVDTGFWSKYGQWGLREYYDAATWSSPAAAGVHAHLDRRAPGPRPSCVVANSRGRGLPPDSFFGPPAVTEPAPGAELVQGHQYVLRWGPAERLQDLQLNFLLWHNSSCGTMPVKASLGSASSRAGMFTWTVPTDIPSGGEYFIELRPRAPSTAFSNYSSLFSIIAEKDAPPTYLLYVANDVDLLSAFYRDCKKESSWAIVPHFEILSCVYSSTEGCREYRTTRKSPDKDGPPPWRHGSFLPLEDCTLHIVGLRQTLRLEGLTRGFDLGAEGGIVHAVANASMLPPGAISISVVGGDSGRRLAAESGSVSLDLEINSDDNGLGLSALALAGLSSNIPFIRQVAVSLGETNLTVSMSGNLSAVDGVSEGKLSRPAPTSLAPTSLAPTSLAPTSLAPTSLGSTSLPQDMLPPTVSTSGPTTGSASSARRPIPTSTLISVIGIMKSLLYHFQV